VFKRIAKSVLGFYRLLTMSRSKEFIDKYRQLPLTGDDIVVQGLALW
jgi:hypothetical protein